MKIVLHTSMYLWFLTALTQFITAGQESWIWMTAVAIGLMCAGFIGIIEAIEGLQPKPPTAHAQPLMKKTSHET